MPTALPLITSVMKGVKKLNKENKDLNDFIKLDYRIEDSIDLCT